MTDTNTTPTAAAIDAMVSALPKGAPAQMPAMRNPDLRIETDGTVTVLAPATHPGIADSVGYPIGESVVQIDREIARLTAEKEELTYDKSTGAPSFTRGERERDQSAARLVTLKASREFQVARDAALATLRKAGAEDQTTARREEAARFSFTQGNPNRGALLDKAIEAEEAKVAAAAIVAGRRRG